MMMRRRKYATGENQNSAVFMKHDAHCMIIQTDAPEEVLKYYDLIQQ